MTDQWAARAAQDITYDEGVRDERARMLALLDKHIPSLSDENETAIYEVMRRMYSLEYDSADVADLALRTCPCGEKIDGFYEYVDHLKEVFRVG